MGRLCALRVHVAIDDFGTGFSSLNMLRRLRLPTVAEGVETLDQAEAAREAGCGELQGYLYSRPLPPQDVGPCLARLATQCADESGETSTQSVKLGE
jgi:EAL domain-containing protein (putative c-di-GMP-specific phosphodiesterase class I)